MATFAWQVLGCIGAISNCPLTIQGYVDILKSAHFVDHAKKLLHVQRLPYPKCNYDIFLPLFNIVLRMTCWVISNPLHIPRIFKFRFHYIHAQEQGMSNIKVPILRKNPNLEHFQLPKTLPPWPNSPIRHTRIPYGLCKWTYQWLTTLVFCSIHNGTKVATKENS